MLGQFIKMLLLEILNINMIIYSIHTNWSQDLDNRFVQKSQDIIWQKRNMVYYDLLFIIDH